MSNKEVKSIRSLFDTLPFQLTEGQRNALMQIENGRHTLLCGKAGTGKSTILEILKEYYGDQILFCGSTGVSNAQLFNFKGGAGTAHRVFSLPLGVAVPKDWKEVNKYTNTLFQGTDQIKIVVIDEGFMLNSEQLALIKHRIQRFNKATKKRKQREIQLVICGDAGQIPPVIKPTMKSHLVDHYGHELFFFSNTFEAMEFQVCFLNEVMRQDDPIFKAGLEAIRYGQKERYTKLLQWFNKRVLPAPEDAVVLAPTNKQVDHYNKVAYDRNPNESFCYDVDLDGSYNIEDCPVPAELFLKEGMQVITLINDSEDGRWVNGTQMTVGQCTAEGVWCTINRTGEEVLVEPFSFEERELYVARQEENSEGEMVDVLEERVKGSCSTIPLKPAAALSGHRSQGMTADFPLLIDMGSDWAFTNTDFGVNLLYVMLSRSTNINNVYLKRPLTKSFIKVCRDTLRWLEDKEKTHK